MTAGNGAPGSYPVVGSVRASAAVLADLVVHASAGLPNEACGVLGGRPGEIVKLYPLTNTAASNERYEVDPYEQMTAYRSMADDGLESVGVYHSHPETPARPSTTDIAEAYDAGAVYVIVSLAAEEPSVRAFRIREGEVGELTIETRGPE